MNEIPLLVQAVLIAVALGVLVFVGVVTCIVLSRETRVQRPETRDEGDGVLNPHPYGCELCDQPAASERASCVDDSWRTIRLCRQHRHEAFDLDQVWDQLWTNSDH